FQNAVSNLMVNMNMSYDTAKTYVYSHLYKHASLDSNVMGINDAFMWATIFCVFGLILSLFLRDVRRDKARAEKKKKEELSLLPAPKEVKES
ncbi:MFS transporter, partial [Bacillus inaquosorum]|nr:MFS transporter [Bacillus inaquosorum]